MYIVILRTQGEDLTPMVSDDDGIVLSQFYTYEGAVEAVASSLLGRACGGIIIDLDEGEDV